jgi:hypothetical protein
LWLVAVLSDAGFQRFSRPVGALLFGSSVREAGFEQLGRCGLALSGTRRGSIAFIFTAIRQDPAALGSTGVFIASRIFALHVVLRRLRLATVFACRRRALVGAIEEAPDRFGKARLAVIASRGALVEHGQRRAETRVATFTGRHALSIGGRR